VLCLMALSGCSLASYSTNTDDLEDELTTCVADIAADIECVQAVEDGLDTMSDVIQTVEALRVVMELLSEGMDTFNTAISIVKYAPGIGTAATVVKNTLTAIRTTFDSALDRVQTIDDAISPMGTVVDAGITTCSISITWLQIMKTTCNSGASSVSEARGCVDSMASGSVRTSCENGLEELGGSLVSPLSSVNDAMGTIATGCDEIRDIVDIGASWPDIDFILDGINDVYDALEPILDFFEALQDALDTDLCITNPFEALAEWEFIEEIGESPVYPGNWGWGRRKRALGMSSVEQTARSSAIRLTNAEASDILSSSIAKRAGEICISAQDILDGIDSLLAPLVDLANDLISAVLSVLPTFELPGFPDFDELFNIDISFDLPTIDFGFDIDVFVDFFWLTWDCATEVTDVCNAVSGGISSDCSAALEDYAPDWGSSWGKRRKRSTSAAAMAHREDRRTLLELVENVARSQKLRTSTRQQIVNKIAEKMDKKSHVDKKTIQVALGPQVKRDRVDNKELTPEEASELISHLTEEQKTMLLEVMEQKQKGRAEAPPRTSRRELLAKLMAQRR